MAVDSPAIMHVFEWAIGPVLSAIGAILYVVTHHPFFYLWMAFGVVVLLGVLAHAWK